MFRYKAVIEYDGTPFHGFQSQGEDIPTVQKYLEEALFKLLKKDVRVSVCGRTDQGVHAFGQVVHLDLDDYFPEERLFMGWNFYLKPNLICILSVEPVDASFHARFSAKSKTYRYVIINRSAPLTLDFNKAWSVYRPLNLEVMIEASKYLLGHHDFTSFRDSDCQALSPMKTLDHVEITKNHDKITFTFQGKAFLHHQVRNMVGTLKLIGERHWPPQDMKRILEAKDRRVGGPTAPSEGLYLVSVSY